LTSEQRRNYCKASHTVLALFGHRAMLEKHYRGTPELQALFAFMDNNALYGYIGQSVNEVVQYARENWA
jgi:hypothetical protein